MTDNNKLVRLELEMTAGEAWDFAQFLKRVGFREFRVNAATEDEAYRMRDAASLVRKTLAQNGFAPR